MASLQPGACFEASAYPDQNSFRPMVAAASRRIAPGRGHFDRSERRRHDRTLLSRRGVGPSDNEVWQLGPARPGWKETVTPDQLSHHRLAAVGIHPRSQALVDQ